MAYTQMLPASVKSDINKFFEPKNQKCLLFCLQLQNKDYLCRYLIKNKKKDASAIFN